MTAMIEVVEPGWATTIQDGGRPGFAHLGVPSSGFVDPSLAGLTNRLVGNQRPAALFETCGGLTIRAVGAVLIATSRELAPISLASGETYRLDPDSQRLWHYLAVRGGIVVETVLGSAATDTLSGLGPQSVTVGDVYPVGLEPRTAIVTDQAPRGELVHVVPITIGPRADWFNESWRRRLTGTSWEVSTSNRVGVRLSGRPLVRLGSGELASEGLVRGALQVPPDGTLVMMLADHPTTGGYPVIAIVHTDDVATVAQHHPGSSIRFRLATE